MKFKLLLATLFLCFSFAIKAQITVDVFINGIKSGQYVVPAKGNDSVGLSYKKKAYKNVDRLSVQLSGKGYKKGYLRKMEVRNNKGEQLLLVDESLPADGQFVLTDKQVLKSLVSGKPVKLYLHLTPGNTLSKEAPSVVFVGVLSRQ